MKTLIILVVVIAIVKIGSASADDQNKQLATTNNQIPALTNHEVRLKGFMIKTKVIALDQSVIDRIKVANVKMKLIRSAHPQDNAPETIVDAGEYLGQHMAMIAAPDVCVEYDGIFYFSGGTSSAQDTNFLSGFAIKKGETIINSW
jgi:hypothetical protein